MALGEEPADGRHAPVGDAQRPPRSSERDFFIDNLLVRIHFIIEMIWWTGLAPWEFEFPFPGSLTSTFLVPDSHREQGIRHVRSLYLLYRATSRIRNRHPVGPYRGPMPRVLGGS